MRVKEIQEKGRMIKLVFAFLLQVFPVGSVLSLQSYSADNPTMDHSFKSIRFEIPKKIHVCRKYKCLGTKPDTWQDDRGRLGRGG